MNFQKHPPFKKMNVNKNSIFVSKIQAMVFFAWVRNFAYNYLRTFGFLAFIIDFNFIIFLIQSLKHSINLHILTDAIYL
jgi:intergrase/recombinase